MPRDLIDFFAFRGPAAPPRFIHNSDGYRAVSRPAFEHTHCFMIMQIVLNEISHIHRFIYAAIV